MSAAKKLALATYRYNDLDQGVKALERRYVSKEVKDMAARTLIVTKLVFDKQIVFRWEF